MLYLYSISGDTLYVCRCYLVEGDVVEECETTKNYRKIEERLDSILDVNDLQQALARFYLGLHTS